MPKVEITLKLRCYLIQVDGINDQCFAFTDWLSAVARKEEIENDYPRWAANYCSEQERRGESPSIDCSKL